MMPVINTEAASQHSRPLGLLFLRRLLFRSQLRWNIISGAGSACVSSAITLASYVVYLRYLGFEQYGLWLALATVLNFAQFGNLGINSALARVVSREFARKDFGALSSYLNTAVSTLLGTGTIFVVGVLVLEGPLIGIFRLSGHNALLASAMLPFIGVISLYAFIVDAFCSTLLGLGRMDLVSYSQTAGMAAGFLIALTLLRLQFGIYSLLIGSAASSVAVHLVSMFFLRQCSRPHRVRIRLAWDRAKFLDLVGFGSWVFASLLVTLCMAPFNRVMLSRYGGLAALPILELGYGASMKLRSVFDVGFRALLPEASSATSGSGSGRSSVGALHTKAVKLVLVAGLPLYAALVALAPSALRILLSREFQPVMVGTVRLFLAGTFVSLLGVPAYYILLGLGNSRASFVAVAVQGAASAIVVVVMARCLPRLSPISIGLATVVGMALFTCTTLGIVMGGAKAPAVSSE